MRYSIHIVLASLLISSLTSCAFQPPKDINSSFYTTPIGSQLKLHRALTIPANNTQVRIQNGEVINSYWDLDAYYPNCNLELRERTEVARIIKPDTFIISRVTRDTENVMLNKPTVVTGFSAGGSAPNVDYLTIMHLHSPRQPEVTQISCQHWEDANDGSHLSIEKIRKTLDGLFTLTLVDD